MIVNRRTAQNLYVLRENGKEEFLCRRLTSTKAETIANGTRKFINAYRRSIERDVWLRYNYDLLHTNLHVAFPNKLPHFMFKNISRQLSTSIIFDGPAFPTGYVSIEALENVPKKNWSKEHFRARQRACETLVKEIYENKGISFERFKEQIEYLCWIHYTTSTENTRLIKLQNDPNGPQDWESQYNLAGIRLVYVEKYRFKNYWER